MSLPTNEAQLRYEQFKQSILELLKDNLEVTVELDHDDQIEVAVFFDGLQIDSDITWIGGIT